MPLTHEEISYYIGQFEASLADKRQPTQDEISNINEALNALTEEETELTRSDYRTAYKLIWEAYHNNRDWRTHIAAIIGKWIKSHQDGFYAGGFQQAATAWITNAREAEDWDDALAAIPIDATACWGI